MARYIVRMDIRKNDQLLRACDFGISKQPKITSLEQARALIVTASWLAGFAIGKEEIVIELKDRQRNISGCLSSWPQSFYQNDLELIIEVTKVL